VKTIMESGRNHITLFSSLSGKKPAQNHSGRISAVNR
jgi:hypothetical protein